MGLCQTTHYVTVQHTKLSFIGLGYHIPHAPRHTGSFDGNIVTKWVKVTLAVSYPEEVNQGVVNVLLRIASLDALRHRIPRGF